VRERLDPMKQKNIGSFFASKAKPADMAMDMEGTMPPSVPESARVVRHKGFGKKGRQVTSPVFEADRLVYHSA